MPASLAPIAVFGYRRPEHLRKCWQSLAKNPEATDSQLFVFLDAAKERRTNAHTDLVYQEAKSICGFKNIEIIKSEAHRGLSKSILQGVRHVLDLYQKVIVVEDDLQVSPHFLGFLNHGIGTYGECPQVASIHGYVYPLQRKVPETFFLKGADCWGWATWQAAWTHFEPDGKTLLEELKIRGLEEEFDLGGVAPFTKMLKSQISGRNDSWAIRWHASAFLAGLHTLYPGRSLVKNTGLDNSGTHCGSTIKFDIDLSPGPVEVLPITVEESAVGRKAFQEFYESSK